MILRFAAAGLDLKISNDMEWDLERSDSQQLLETSKSKSFSMDDVVERKLNLADTEGMFLLMAIGYILAGSVLFSEIVGGCAKSCRAFIRRNSGNNESRGSICSASQMETISEPKTFADKFKRKIRHSLRSKPKPPVEILEEDPNNPDEQEKGDEQKDTEKLSAPELKGPTSFCTLKRIMLMRKRRRDEKKAKKVASEANNDIAANGNKESGSNVEKSLDFVRSAEGGEHIMIENEKSGESGDAISLIGSSSVFSETQTIQEETAVEVNELSVSDRENNPSKEFGDIV